MASSARERQKQLIEIAVRHNGVVDWDKHIDVRELYRGELQRFYDDCRAIERELVSMADYLNSIQTRLPTARHGRKQFRISCRRFARRLGDEGRSLKSNVARRLVDFQHLGTGYLLPRDASVYAGLGTTVFLIVDEILSRTDEFPHIQIYTNTLEIAKLIYRSALDPFVTGDAKLFLWWREVDFHSGVLGKEAESGFFDIAIVGFGGLTDKGKMYTRDDVETKMEMMDRAQKRVLIVGDSHKISNDVPKPSKEFKVPTKKSPFTGQDREICFVTDRMPKPFHPPPRTKLIELSAR